MIRTISKSTTIWACKDQCCGASPRSWRASLIRILSHQEMMGEGLQMSYRNFKLERINILRVYCLKEKILISQEFLCGLPEYQMNGEGLGSTPAPTPSHPPPPLHLTPSPHPTPTSSIMAGFELLGLGWSAGGRGWLHLQPLWS